MKALCILWLKYYISVLRNICQCTECTQRNIHSPIAYSTSQSELSQILLKSLLVQLSYDEIFLLFQEEKNTTNS